MNCALRVGTVVTMVSMDRDDLRVWLRAVLQHMGWTGSDLAKKIEVAASTINRFLNDPGATHSLSPRNLKAIEQATGYAPLMMPGARARHLLDPEAVAFDAAVPHDEQLAKLVREMAHGSAIDPWVLRSRALEAAGFFPGDVLLVNLQERPRARDVVCAQVLDYPTGSAETIFRIYEPPYLIAATSQPELMKPMLVDDDRVVVMGVVTHSMRPRRSAAFAA